jgi:APA family basic amino acid/polyamine antiporter
VIASASIVCLTLANIFGVRKGAILQNITTWIKFLAIVAFVVLGLMFGRGSWSHYSASTSLPSSSPGFAPLMSGIGVALIAVFWAYDGWVYITWVAGEVKDPQRNIPRSLILGLLLVGLLYIAINATYLYALPMKEISAQTAVAQAAAASMFGSTVGRWLAAMIAISCFGAMAACIMTGARVYYAMAEDGIFFRTLAKVNPRWHTPVASLVLQALLSIALALSGRYDQLFTYVMFMMVLSYALTVVAVFVLRRTRPEAARPYRCTGYPWLPALYVLLSGAWIVNAIVERTTESLAGILIVATGIPFYLYWKARKASEERASENRARSACGTSPHA